MMLPINKMKDNTKNYVSSKKGIKYSDTIYTFDIETTSLFNINNKYTIFDYSIPQKSTKKIIGYDKIDKKACCYHCQFSINDEVYYFRNIADFEKVLLKISNKFVRKIIWVHNLSFETQWILPILAKYTIVGMIARTVRKPIAFTVQELNIEFRCSYCLTNLSLAKASEKYTNVKKAVGDLDYNVARSPLTTLTEKEKYYCEMDCITLYNIILYFRRKYEHLYNIPYTQTGEMRRAYKQVIPQYHYNMVRKCVPDLFEYKSLKEAFAGGITHANCLHINELCYDIDSVDIASSYPFTMCAEKFPCEKFYKIDNNMLKYYNNDNFAIIYKVEFYKVKSKIYNHFLSRSKCNELVNEIVDNGRIVTADRIFITLTDVDYELFKKCYNFEKEKIYDIQVAKKDYLPKYFINFILDNYSDKTKLKGIPDKTDFYMKAKQTINACYGACVMDIVQSSVCINGGKWIQSNCDDDFIKLKLQEEKDGFGLFVYSVGVWVTAYARRNLFERLTDNNYELDFDVVYYDTDSLKIFNMDKHRHIFEEYNKKASEKLLKMCCKLNIDYEKTRPKDIKGIEHPLGVFDMDDGHYSEFKTLGAKRYAYRDKKDNSLHITVSGVSKAGVSALDNDINNFTKDLFFNYENAHKNLLQYNDNQEEFSFVDCEGNNYKCDWKSSIVVYPTTYSLTIEPDFEDFINLFVGYINSERLDNFKEIYLKLKAKKY